MGFEMLRIRHCSDNLLVDGGKDVSPSYRPSFTPQKHYFSVSTLIAAVYSVTRKLVWTSFSETRL
jgi:hypothetical protein